MGVAARSSAWLPVLLSSCTMPARDVVAVSMACVCPLLCTAFWLWAVICPGCPNEMVREAVRLPPPVSPLPAVTVVADAALPAVAV